MKEDILILIEENKKLIYKIASRYSSYYDIEDLFQVGVIGLINAYKKYIRGSPTKFSTFAYEYIFGEIVKYIKNDRNIRISSDYFKIYKLYLTAKEVLEQKYERSPSVGEIANFIEITEEELVNVITTSEFTLSLDTQINESGISFEELVSYDEREEVNNRVAIKESIERLEQMAKRIIELRYYKNYSQSETAEILGISQAQVSRKEVSILKLMKQDIA